MKFINIQEEPFGITVLPIQDINRYNFLSKVKSVSNDISDYQLSILINQGIDTLVRGTSYGNLKNVLNSGIDVVPSNAPIFCTSYPEKALEYGWDDRNITNQIILMFYDRSKLERTFLEISSDTSQAEIDELTKIYPTIEYSKDGSKIWLSRLQQNDTRRTTDYESEYAFWIPGNPLNALVWVILLGSFNHQEIDDLKSTIV